MESKLIIQEVAEAHLSSWIQRTNSFHKTLRYMIAYEFASSGKTNWVNNLKTIISEYNATPNRAFDPSLNNPRISIKRTF